MAEAIVGRAAELNDVVELLEDDAGAMRALVLEGEAGIGKTTLWRAGIEHARARSLPALSAQPAQAESLLPFAALGDLLAPILDERLPLLAPPARAALEIALQRRAAEEPAEQLAVSRATLELLGLDGDPLLLALDDVQWLDPPSERTLEFVLRRLRDASVRVLLTRRSEVELPAPLSLERALHHERLHSRRLGPMTLGELDELLRGRLDLRLPRPKLVHLREVSGGNRSTRSRSPARRRASTCLQAWPPRSRRGFELCRRRRARRFCSLRLRASRQPRSSSARQDRAKG